IRDDLVTGVQTCALPILPEGEQSPFLAGAGSEGRVPSTGWCGCAGSGRTTITGHSSATAAGATRTCCRSSGAWKATPAAIPRSGDRKSVVEGKKEELG